MDRQESELVRSKLPCEACGSSDAKAEYSDGHTHCFSCGEHRSEGASEGSVPAAQDRRQAKGLVAGEVPTAGLSKRGLTAETCKRWSYEIGKTEKGVPVQIANYRDLQTGQVIGQKLRSASKDFITTGDFKKAPLYGQWLWNNRQGGINRIVITEGEIDAMSVSQMQGHKWPVVSIPNGASGARKALQKQLEWLDGFDEVVLMFDNDEVGREAAASCADLFEIGKCKIATLPLKDANDMLVAGRTDEVIKAIWNARTYRPDGIMTARDLRERVIKKRTTAVSSIPYPYQELNKLTKGARPGELVLLTAASGTGKSSFVREIAMHLHDQGERVGMIMLEEDPERTLEGLVSIRLNVPYEHIRDVEQDAFLSAFDELFKEERLYINDHWGSSDIDEILSRIRFMAKGLGCRWVVLDHITIMLSGLEIADERKAIDVAVTRLRKLIQETGITIFLISHLSRPEGNKGHEEGLQISTKHLRGSHALVQLSDIAIALERNQQAEEESERNLTKLRVLKNRFNGKTGPAGFIGYSDQTGRIREVEGPKTFVNAEEEADAEF
jgi:twinkle protein